MKSVQHAARESGTESAVASVTALRCKPGQASKQSTLERTRTEPPRRSGPLSVPTSSKSRGNDGQEHEESPGSDKPQGGSERSGRATDDGNTNGSSNDMASTLASSRTKPGSQERGDGQGEAGSGSLFGANRTHVGFSRKVREEQQCAARTGRADRTTTWNGREAGPRVERNLGNGWTLLLGSIGSDGEQSSA